LLLLLWAILYAQRSWSVLSFPFGYDYGETPELDRAVAVAHGHLFYNFWTTPPYQMANYTPLFPLLNGLFVHYFGIQYQSGRGIAWTCGLLFCAGLGWLAWRASGRLLPPAVTVLLWFSSHYVWDWTPLGREDELAMLLSVAGLIIFYEGAVRRQREAAVWLAFPCFFLAMYARQTTIEAAVACSLYLLFKRPALAVRFIAALVLLSGATFALLDAGTHGAFYLNIVTGNLNRFSWARVVFMGKQFWQYYQVAALLAALYVLTQAALRRQQLFTLWLVLTLAVSVTVGKLGAAENYGLLPWGAVSLAAGLGVGRLRDGADWLWRRAHGRLPLRAVALATALIAGLALLLQAQLTYRTIYYDRWTTSTFLAGASQGLPLVVRRLTDTGWYTRLIRQEPSPPDLEGNYHNLYKATLGLSDRQEQAALDPLAAGTPGDVLDEDMTHTLLSGKQVYLQPFEFSEEARAGRWDQQPLLEAIRQQRFALVIMTYELSPQLQIERFTPQMIEALSANYCEVSRTIHYFVYDPCAH